MLFALSGLPGTSKTTIARLLARRLCAVHVRVDTIEQAAVADRLRGLMARKVTSSLTASPPTIFGSDIT
jgi:predicted kinase